MHSHIIICGKGGSGKDFLKEKFLDKGFNASVSYTTRPPREGEIDGYNYNFVTPFDFGVKKAEGFFLETDVFNGWFYGTPRHQFEQCQRVAIMTPRGISNLPVEMRLRCVVIYLDIAESTRWERLLKRGDSDSVKRRIEADKADFKDFTNFDFRVNNERF